MSQQHLTVGSVEPPRENGKLRLYSMEYCPYAQRVRLVLNAKKIPHDIVNINLAKKPEWYLKIHPEGKVPAITIGSETIVESLDIANWLDEKYPDYPLYPQDPEAKKRDIAVIEKMGPLLALFYKCLSSSSEKLPKEWGQEFTPIINVFEQELTARNTLFFYGDRPGMVDFMLWPWAERAGAIAMALQEIPFEDGQFPNMKKWRKAMKENEVCAAILHGPEPYWKLFQHKLNNTTPDYDNL